MADPALEAIIDRPVDPPPAAPAAAAPAPAPGAPAAGSDSWLDTLPPDAAKEIRRLRDEAAGYRTRGKDLDVFDGYDPDDRQFLLDLVRDIQTSPTTAVQRARQLIDVLGGNIDAPAAVDDEARPLTKAEVAAMLKDFAAEQQTTARQESAINDVYAEAEKLGYKRNTKDMVELLWVAANETENDVAAAHKKIVDDRQAIVDAAIEAKRADAANSPRVVRSAGAAPGGDKPIKSLKDAKAALNEALNAGNF